MPDKCPDCQIVPGERHLNGCDVARCSLHGLQWIVCQECLNRVDHEDFFDAAPTVWTGEWPGVEECQELDLYVWDFPGIPGKSEDLNRLVWMGMTGQLVWSPERERWTRPDKSAKLGA